MNNPFNESYSVFYVVDGACLCGECCNKELENNNSYFTPIDHPATNNKDYNEEITEAINYDNDDLYCDLCKSKIEIES